MDRTESHVAKHLASRGFSDVIFEPLGKSTPPDFLVDGRIAVEARRLNQHHDAGHGPRALEEAAYPLHHRVQRLLTTFGMSEGESWFVCYHFGRPLEKWSTLSRKLELALREFKCSSPRIPKGVLVSERFELQFLRASDKHASFFLLGAMSDNDSGGFVVSEVSKSLEICIVEKTRKTAEIRSVYPEWWLVLVDHIGYGLDCDDQEHLRAANIDRGDWAKIVLVDPLNPCRAFDL